MVVQEAVVLQPLHPSDTATRPHFTLKHLLLPCPDSIAALQAPETGDLLASGLLHHRLQRLTIPATESGHDRRTLPKPSIHKTAAARHAYNAAKSYHYDYYEHHDHCIIGAWSITGITDQSGIIIEDSQSLGQSFHLCWTRSLPGLAVFSFGVFGWGLPKLGIFVFEVKQNTTPQKAIFHSTTSTPQPIMDGHRQTQWPAERDSCRTHASERAAEQGQQHFLAGGVGDG